MLPTLYAKFIIACCWVFLSNVYSQSTGCGYVNTDLQNTNAEGAWPWMVAITKEKKGKHGVWCNGFLVDRRHALTTASCFDSNYNVTDFVIRIGNMNWNEGEAYKVSSVIKHPRYESGKFFDDIAILTLSINVDTPNYAPICLADDNLSLDGVEVTKTAWGTIKADFIISETMIQNAGLRVISNRDCYKSIKKLVGSSSTRQFPGGLSCGMMCTENPTEQMESCAGSGGAPLMYRDDSNNWIAVGISSFGYFCATGPPSGFTRVSPYLEWITENTDIGENKDCGHVNTDLQNTNVWPWMAAITKKEKNGNRGFWCNGFLIDQRHVLTAAHCYEGKYDVSDFLIYIGKKNWDEGESYKVTCIKKHPRYEKGQYYDDIAILTLARDVNSPNYASICIPDDNLRIRNMTGVEVTKTAWGALTNGGIINRTLIQNKGLRIISNKDCHQTYGKLLGNYFLRNLRGGVSADMVCAENPTEQTETCGGDSGAPLMYRDESNKWIAVGVVSFGYSCKIPTVFIKVSAYLEWIAENTINDKGDCN